MTTILCITPAHPFWEKVIRFAEHCSWRAGKTLAEKMKNGDFLDWERVFCAVVDGEVAGFCTLTEKDELRLEYDFSPFIGFVFVGEAYRGNRLSEHMIGASTEYAQKLGFQKVYIMSGEIGLYEKYGFRKIGIFPTIYNTTDQLFERETACRA